MPQHDYDIINAPGASVRADINNALAAILSQNSGPTEPTETAAYMIWVDTTSKTHNQRNSTDSAWIILHKIDSLIVHKDDIGANIASSSTVDLATATGKTITVTGSAAITSFGTVDAGFNFTLVFSSNPVITHNVVSLILPGGANITAAAGDVMQLVSLGSGNWRVTNYTRADGTSVVPHVPPAFRGALVTPSSTSSFSSGNFIIINFTTEEYDTDNIHDNSTNTSRLTVPTGVSKVIVRAGLSFNTDILGARAIRLGKNGTSVFSGNPRVGRGPGNDRDAELNISSPVLFVNAGDYFELTALQQSGTVLGIDEGETWFSMEIIE